MVQIVSLPNVPGPPPHHHDEASELFYVIEGQLDVMVNGEWRVLRSGQSLCIPPGTVHTLRNNSDTDCRWLTAWSPRGFERFFVDLGVPAEQEDSQAESVSDARIQSVVERCGDYGMIVANG